jgi:hypothetical protein
LTDRDPPEHIRRQVRQRCRFGCVMCGKPLIHYDHIVEYNVVKCHEVQNIALLCGGHHDEKTRGHLAAEFVQEALDEVVRTGKRAGGGVHDLRYRPNFFVHMGTNVVEGRLSEQRPELPVITIDDTVILGFRFEDGQPLINMRMFDENNKLILRVRKNQLVTTTDIWDQTLVGTKLTMHQARRSILLVIDFQAPDKIVIERGQFYAFGIGLRVDAEALTVMNNEVGFAKCRLGGRGFSFGESSDKDLEDLSVLRVRDIPRYKSGPGPDAFLNVSR